MKWQLHGESSDKVASIMLAGISEFKKPLAKVMGVANIPYSGIVISNNDSIADGSLMEKRCYHNGGFRFIYRSYVEKTDIEFPINKLKTFIEKIARLYSIEVLGQQYHLLLESCWGVCQREGDYGAMHNHTSAQGNHIKLYSGILYLNVPKSINPNTFPDGCLHIVTESGLIYLPPIEGSIIFWPGELIHGIHPFRGSGDRLGIAFNLFLDNGE